MVIFILIFLNFVLTDFITIENKNGKIDKIYK